MGVRVDPAGRDHKPVGVDVTLGGALFAADRGEAAIGNRDIAGERGLAGAIDNGAAANDDVVHGRRSLDLLLVGRSDSEIHMDSTCMMRPAR